MAQRKFTMPTGEVLQMDMPEFKTPYNHNREFESKRVATYCQEPSLTKQEFKEDADINVILKRVLRTGETPPIVLPEHFADLTGRTNYFEMASKIADANSAFYMLDAKLRAEHLNDPARWADAVVTALEQGNADQLEKLGIPIEKKPQEQATGSTPPGGTPAPGSGNAQPAAPTAATGAATGQPAAPST